MHDVGGLTERSIAFGPGEGLVGTLCLPAAAAAPGPQLGLVLFNAGVIHRVGPHRFNVRLARLLARRGIPSLRFDLTGHGDSARSDGRLPYEAQAVADLRHAMDALAAEADLGRFALFGYCSGARHAWAAALADPRVASVMMFDNFQYPTLRTRLNSYRARLRRRGFLNAVRGWTTRQVGNLARRASGIQAANGSKVEWAPFPAKRDFAEGAKQLHARGVKLGFLWSTSFEEYYNYPAQFADAFRGLGVDAIADWEYATELDHNAMLMSTQEKLMQRVERFVTQAERELAAGSS